ncbi:ATP-binding protein [Salmonella enterica]|uniref:ATP-binding protein n=4 Tax=Salmonella enterica TaxID=28901 RepID=A0A3R0VII7_SALET|nr:MULTISPECIES: ATP-binding protein [Salmonella]EBA1416519.1 ATP-binding protein [Salmonella enterica subsp. enterica serovar Enteritidis]EBC9853021.1 ATP-binding protein [Salmonella enterica subsp. enterica serovar Agama]ECQ3982698.1 ATP-binding protein [Salmonella enterica subsp. enterica serovar Infantis]EDA6664598.1 ATP-binding protein [Salmonella enterica subsp. enterica serovar Muenster]EDS5540757.1 ATP-binding protein [Salmonella enterica subsp. enterica serovar Uganda]EDU9828458.1 AT
MSNSSVFEVKTNLPTAQLDVQAQKLLGFEGRYTRVKKRLQLILQANELDRWSQTYHKRKLAVIGLLDDQYPLAIFHGDVGTGKTANAEAIANRLARDAKLEDAILFKLSNKVRGTGKVGEMGTLITQAFEEITRSIGPGKGRAFLIIDEGDSLGASRSQDHSHHEDKVGVNTLIQSIDGMRKHSGRIFVILCTNRLRALDAAVIRRASIVEEFTRPSDTERHELFTKDLGDMGFSPVDVLKLVKATAATDTKPAWTYSDIRTRLYPAAVSLAFPNSPLTIEHFYQAVAELGPSPVMAG